MACATNRAAHTHYKMAGSVSERRKDSLRGECSKTSPPARSSFGAALLVSDFFTLGIVERDTSRSTLISCQSNGLEK